ncbi:xanthine dehydrogenase family protein molybdopterin-binding subunit [Aliiroseovarius sp. PTFE2010]|uniref:xanthine dehydrogenase family protein molybdopterin-binding subunit n=1 Tax=Aliiroseovarius sp. PTFE2010 TaxID=3417190 RepID=UPI003CF009B5
MEKFGKSQPVRRREDLRFLTGHGRYVDNIAPADALHGVFLRSPVAHGDITELDLEDARAAPGVAAVLSVADMEAAGMDISMSGSLMTNRDGSRGAAPLRPMLAKDRVRHVGEPIALVVADTLDQARDAAELILFDFNELPVKMDVAPGGPTIHPEAPDNVAYDWAIGDETQTEAAFQAAAHVVKVDVPDNRVIVNSLEPRGCYAQWQGDRVHLCFNGQGVWGMKGELVRAFGINPDQVRVTHPDVGGGFGMKAAPYPEYFACALAARVTGRPVRWMSERTEAMLSDHAGRDLTSTCELALDADYRITGYRVTTLSNLGVYNSNFGQSIQSFLFARVLTGTYDVANVFLAVKGIYTNTTQVDAYRGAGRPEAIYALERTMDYAARQLGIDPRDLRRINFIKPDQFPYDTQTGELYDVGEFARVLDRATAEADWDGFDARRAASAAAGKLRGRGLCYYIESILGDPSETAHVEFLESGRVNLYVGTQSNGQGHETVYAQFLADQTGIEVDRIDVIQGDSDLIPTGGGTGGSRSVTTQNNATLATATFMIEAFSEFLAEDADVPRADVSFDDEHFRIDGSNDTPTMMDVAEMARKAARTDLLSFRETARLDARSFPNGCHIAEVEIDPDTGKTQVVKYTVADDFGNLINPLLAQGQVHGGVAQGIGQAITEDLAFDESGQLLSATFMDYGLPRADDVPFIAFHSEPVPSKANVMGIKGCGEAGTVGALAAVANAALDAMWGQGVRVADMPFTPSRVWSTLQEVQSAPE